MFLKPEQQLERCKRIVRQRVDPHIHPSIAQLAVESFDIPGEPMPTDEFFEIQHPVQYRCPSAELLLRPESCTC